MKIPHLCVQGPTGSRYIPMMMFKDREDWPSTRWFQWLNFKHRIKEVPLPPPRGIYMGELEWTYQNNHTP